MSNSYKNVERLRFRLSQDINRIYEDYCEKSTSIKNNINNILFSSIFSGFAANVLFSLSTKNKVELNYQNVLVQSYSDEISYNIIGYINTELSIKDFLIYVLKCYNKIKTL